MKLRVTLRDLDARCLAAAAERAGALADRLVVQRHRVVAWGRGLKGIRLKELDARYARSGPLALMREVPQVGFVLIAAVFLAGAGTVVTRDNARNKRADQNVILKKSPGATSPDGLTDTALGPAVGDTTTNYFATSLKGLEQAATRGSHDERFALVSFSDYHSPTQVQAMLAGDTVRRVFLRAKAGGKDAAQLPVDIKGDLLSELQRVYAQTARGRLDARKSYLGYVNSLRVSTKEDRDFQQLYASFAKTTGIEAREYQHGCACVYAAVVEAKASLLLELRSRPFVRGVQVAGRGLELRQLQVLPLLPEISGVVPRQQAGVDAQP